MNKITVKFDNDIIISKTRNQWIKELINYVIESCQDDGVYADNTVHDFYLYGFKGISNMTDEELKQEVSNTLESLY
jgi:hypothetical protein